MRLEDALDLRIENEGTTVVVNAAGELDMFSIRRLERAVRDELEQGRRQIVIDLSEVSFVDVQGYTTLLSLSSEASALGGRLIAQSPTRQFLHIRDLIDVNGVLRVDFPHSASA